MGALQEGKLWECDGGLADLSPWLRRRKWSGGNRLLLGAPLELVSPGGGDKVLRASLLHLKGGSSFPSLNYPLEKPQDGHGWRQRKPWFQPGLLVPGLVWPLGAEALCSWNVWELPVQPLNGQGEEAGKGCPTVTAAPQFPRPFEAAFRPGGHLVSWVHSPTVSSD